MTHWASVARYGSIDHKQVSPHNPHFIRFPTNMVSLQPETSGVNQTGANYVIRKFVFPNTKLNVLKNKVQVGTATRVELVTSLIYKTTMEAATTTSGSFRPSSLLIPVDIRKKCYPKLPQTSVGNFTSFMMVKTMQRNETSLSSLVLEIKKEKMELERVKGLQHACQHVGSFLSRLANENSDDDAAGASIVQAYANKTGWVLMDTPDGDGIEAHVVLEDKNMEIFENDKEMLSFCQR
ncbi:hypothetical protein QVD17_42114 [Tagetes erecta]|uniref:Uncharacterized protein n=1 Tax=Tagetes erecta TaxID=13708 RepID=A0AAD8N979_TARER|nr:hypothetical protein QVD17_42114 [Tagetes erecta]